MTNEKKKESLWTRDIFGTGPRWHVEGVHKESGETVMLCITAKDRDEAEKMLSDRGIMVSLLDVWNGEYEMKHHRANEKAHQERIAGHEKFKIGMEKNPVWTIAVGMLCGWLLISASTAILYFLFVFAPNQ